MAEGQLTEKLGAAGVVAAAVPAGQADGRALVNERRPGNEVHHALVDVRTVEGRARPEDELDPIDVLVRRRDQVVGVEAERRHRRPAVVRHDEEGAGEHVVESARHHVVLRQTGRHHVGARQ